MVHYSNNTKKQMYFNCIIGIKRLFDKLTLEFHFEYNKV